MPTYDYECSACGHRFEHFQKITDDPLVSCPECKKKKLVRLFGTGAAVVFKGSGFYQTDYRSESYKKAASQEKSSGDGKSTEKSSGKSATSDGKPASDSKSTNRDSGGSTSKSESRGNDSKGPSGKDSSKKSQD